VLNTGIGKAFLDRFQHVCARRRRASRGPKNRRPWEGRPRTPLGSRDWRRWNRARSPVVAQYSSCAQPPQWQR